MERKSLVTLDQWGKDHWSTLVYAETRTVDYDGYLDMRHMRMDGDRYPTILKDGEFLGHTDLDCLFDAQDLGLLSCNRATQRDGRGSIKQLTYHVVFTLKGRALTDKLRAHIAEGGRYGDFEAVHG